MADASRRAARRRDKGGLPNARFVVAAAEALPPELGGRVDQLTIQFPWGSLLRGTLALDDAVATGIARLLAEGASATALVAPSPRDGLADVPPPAVLIRTACLAELRARWRRQGLEVVEVTEATVHEVDATRSTWARRLRAARDPARPVARVVLHRPRGGITRVGA